MLLHHEVPEHAAAARRMGAMLDTSRPSELWFKREPRGSTIS